MKTPTDAYMNLTAMHHHRADGIPTQFVHDDRVRAAAEILYRPFPQWFSAAVAISRVRGGSLTLTAQQLDEIADSVLMPCPDCGGQASCPTCYNAGMVPR